jgi:hypothetical protein
METKEERNDEKKVGQEWPNMSCCGAQGSPTTMPDCCKSIGEAVDCRSMMAKCMKGCGWFPLVPVVLGVAFLLLGYYLDAEITRVLWMIAAGFVILMGAFGLLMMSRIRTMCCAAE